MFSRYKYHFKGLIASVLLLLLSSLLIADQNDYDCKLEYIDEPPFWIVTGDKSMQDREYENLKGEKEQEYRKVSRNTKFTIPKRSIVIKDPDRPTVYHPSSTQEFMPIIVASTPNDQDTKKQFIASGLNPKESFSGKIKTATSTRIKSAKAGTRGYIYAGSLKKRKGELMRVNPSIIPPGTLRERVKKGTVDKDFIFIVKKDSNLIQIPGVEKLDQTYSLKLKTSNGKYLVNFCRNSINDEDVKINYIFDVTKTFNDGTVTQAGHLELDPLGECAIETISELLPLEEDLYRPLLSLANAFHSNNQGIEDVLLLEGKRLAQIPQSDPERIGDQCYTKGPYNSFHYVGGSIGNCKGKWALREQNSDSLLKPHVACAVTSSLKRINKRCKDCSVQWGDCFWPAGRHNSHYRGVCIDFRPLKTDNELGANNITWKKTYDRDKTRIIVEEMMRSGASFILFNDTKLDDTISKELKSVTWYTQDATTKKVLIKGVPEKGIPDTTNHIPVKLSKRSHSNHIHICFPQYDVQDLSQLVAKRDKIKEQKFKTKRDKKKLIELSGQIERQKRMKKSCLETI